jgi:hypothetical protein
MGLEAVVYINVRRLPPTIDLSRASIDPHTGEVSSELSEPLIAIQRRIGNASMVAWLAREVARALVGIPESMILANVLYSASHSGDTIAISDFGRLQQEIEIVSENYRENPEIELEEFLASLRDLIIVGRDQDNPIVFV